VRCGALVAVLAGAVGSAPGGSAHAPEITPASVALLERWDAAVRTHEPGQVDEALDHVVAITLDDRRTLDPAMRLFLPALTGRSPDASNELERRVVRRGVEASRTTGVVPYLKRGAMLHLDAAIVGEAKPPAAIGLPPASPGPAASPMLATRRMTVTRDGTILGQTESDWNWPFARSLIELLRSSAPADGFPAEWFHTSSAYMFSRGLYAEALDHLAHAARLLPGDALVLFDRASIAEIQGLPAQQVLLRDADMGALRRSRQGTGSVPRSVTDATRRAARLGIPAKEEANADAERLFRRALKADPRLAEARLRLARVLIERKRHEEAAGELKIVLEESRSPFLRFHAYLFSGRAEQALGRPEAAAASVAEAVKLFPTAQSALLAQSQLAVLRADAAGAIDPIGKLPDEPELDLRAGDPWWAYRLAAGRDWEDLYEALSKIVPR
jgi:tetratricopeptide (TPR) repeat protein